MTFDEFRQAVAEAEAVERRAADIVQQLARICAGRLRNSQVPGYILVKLKQELRDFNMKTRTWRDK
jgi:ribosomal protein L39E